MKTRMMQQLSRAGFKDAESFAEYAGFLALANTYLREVDGGRLAHESCLRSSSQGEVRHLSIVIGDGGILSLEVDYLSRVGRHGIRSVKFSPSEESRPRPVSWFRASMMLIGDLYRGVNDASRNSRNEAELVARWIESVGNMSTALQARHGDDVLVHNAFLASEQSLLLGHWMHPTPKSRQGVAWWQQDTFSPELKGGFRLGFFAVDSTLIAHASAADRSAKEIVRDIPGADFDAEIGEGETIVPVHPLQAQWLSVQPYVRRLMESGRIRYLGERGEVFYATSSVRTVFRDDFPWMFKFSIPVRITNSLRINRSHELDVGAVMARLLRNRDFFDEYPYFHVIHDPAYLTVNLPGMRESGFETIIRENPFRGAAGKGIVCLAALTQDPLPCGEGLSRLGLIIRDLADLEGRARHAVARDWFEQYWHCAIEPLMLLFDRHGVALEAHQQNSLLNVGNGYPTHYHYRDNQGFYLSKERREILTALEPGVSSLDGLFYDEPMIFRRFGYYLIFNQLFAVIHRLGADGCLDESESLAMCRDWLGQIRMRMNSSGLRFADYLRCSPTLSCKANLLTRVRDMDELEAVGEMVEYVEIGNPFLVETVALEPKKRGIR